MADRGSITKEAGYAVIRVPLPEVHSLRVALEPCGCRATKSKSTEDIRARLSKGLARLEAGK